MSCCYNNLACIENLVLLYLIIKIGLLEIDFSIKEIANQLLYRITEM